MNFKGKAILLFAPSFFGYEKSIQKRLIELGANVDFFVNVREYILDQSFYSFISEIILYLYNALLSYYLR